MKIDKHLVNLKSGVCESVARNIQNQIMNNQTKALKRHNHKISQLKDGRYTTHVDDASSKEGRKKLVAPTREELLDKLALWYFPIEAEAPLKAVKGTLSAVDLFDEWLEGKMLEGRSTNANRLWHSWKTYCLEEPLSYELIHKPLCQITTRELQRWVNALNKKYDFEVSQYYNATSPLRQLLAYATEEKYIEENPYIKNLVKKDKFRVKDEPKPETQVFFIDELDELMALADDGTVAGMAIRFMLKTGLRRAELIGLKFSDITNISEVIDISDENRQEYSEDYVVNVNRQYVFDFETDENGHPTKKVPKLLSCTKTPAGKRYIYLVKDARDILEEVKTYNDEHNLGGEFIFRSDYFADFHLGYEAVEDKLIRICKKMETIPKSQHKLRKTFISTLLDSGVNIDEVRRVSGHEDERTTLKNYCFNRRNTKQTMLQYENALAS